MRLLRHSSGMSFRDRKERVDSIQLVITIYALVIEKFLTKVHNSMLLMGYCLLRSPKHCKTIMMANAAMLCRKVKIDYNRE